MHGDNAKEHFVPDQLILIQADMYHSVQNKLLKIQLINNTSMNMLKDQDLAEGLDFDYLNIKIYPLSNFIKQYVKP